MYFVQYTGTSDVTAAMIPFCPIFTYLFYHTLFCLGGYRDPGTEPGKYSGHGEPATIQGQRSVPNGNRKYTELLVKIGRLSYWAFFSEFAWL